MKSTTSCSITIQGPQGKITLKRRWRKLSMEQRVVVRGTPPREALVRILEVVETLNTQEAANG